MRWSESESLSVNISKDTVQERLSEPIPENRKTAKKTDPGIDSISGERITNGIVIQGTYKVISDPIRGGMGCVYRVHHTGWDVDLAMKRPHSRYCPERRIYAGILLTGAVPGGTADPAHGYLQLGCQHIGDVSRRGGRVDRSGLLLSG